MSQLYSHSVVDVHTGESPGNTCICCTCLPVLASQASLGLLRRNFITKSPRAALWLHGFFPPNCFLLPALGISCSLTHWMLFDHSLHSPFLSTYLSLQLKSKVDGLLLLLFGLFVFFLIYVGFKVVVELLLDKTSYVEKNRSCGLYWCIKTVSFLFFDCGLIIWGEIIYGSRRMILLG